MRKIIEVKNLYKLYRVGDSAAVRALDGVDFAIYEGSFALLSEHQVPASLL